MRGVYAAAIAMSFAVFGWTQPAKPITDAEIREAIKQLSDDRFAVRQKAFKLLMNAGDAAEKPLREVVNSLDPDVARQARQLLERIAYRIDAATPPEIVNLLQRFRNSEGVADEQAFVVRELLRLGSGGHKHLLRILDVVDVKQRRMLLDQFAFDNWKVLSALMGQGEEEIVGRLLETAIAAQNDAIIPHFAAYQLLTGRLAPAIAAFRQRLEQTKQVYDARVLLALYRLQGDAEGVRWAAERTQNPQLIRQFQVEHGRWAELAAAQEVRVGNGVTVAAELGFRAAFTRLAGKTDALVEIWKRLQEFASEPGNRSNRAWYAAKALLANEQPHLALDLLRRHKQVAIAAELLMAEGKFREALELSEQAAKAEAGPKYVDRSFHIELLLRVGEMEKASEWLKKVVHDMGDNSEPNWHNRLSLIQSRLGERAEVEKRLLNRMERRDGSSLSVMFGAVLPRLQGRAEIILEMMTEAFPNETPAQQFERLKQLEEGRMPPGDVTALFRVSPPINRNSTVVRFEPVAEAIAILGLTDVAQNLLFQPNWDKAPAVARLSLADALADAGRWTLAVDAYRKVWDQDRAAPLPLFLHAQARLRLDLKDSEAKTLIERSHRLPLGSDSIRHYFRLALYERGYGMDAERELRICHQLTNVPYFSGSAEEDLARLVIARGDPAAGAAFKQQTLLRAIPTSSGYRASAIANLAVVIHALQARGFLLKGDNDSASREIERAEALQSGGLDLAIHLVPALERAGQKGRADALFNLVMKHWSAACAEFPRCAEAHNNVAWLCARCRRRLDDGMNHARQAMELRPGHASYIDTMAELHFQRGQRADAIELIRKAVQTPGANRGYYRQQLHRFQQGRPEDDPAEE